jgi:hypothetical protein
MDNADEFKRIFDRCSLEEARLLFTMLITDCIISPMTIIIDFLDGSTFRYYI